MIIVFDTETTGKPKDYKRPMNDIDNWPRIVQFAYQVYSNEGELQYQFNSLIQPDSPEWQIEAEAQAVHGYSREDCEANGKPLNEVMAEFCRYVESAKVLVAHNVGFDRPVLICEMLRSKVAPKSKGYQFTCTMKSTTDLCKLSGPYGFKWPKLQELHNFLFGKDFEGAHDALDDVRATAVCYFELVNRKFIFKH